MVTFFCIVYFLTIILYFFKQFKMSIKDRKLLLIIWGILLFIVVVFRPIEIADTANYKEIFEKIDIDRNYLRFSSDGILRKEPTTAVEYGFVVLTQLIKRYITNNFRVYFGIICLLEFLFFMRYMRIICEKDYKKIGDCLYYLLPYFGFMYLLVVIRGGLAYAIAFNAYALTKEWNEVDKSKPMFFRVIIAALLYFVAFSIHRLVFLFLVVEAIYFLVPVFNKKIYKIIWIIAFALEFFNLLAAKTIFRDLMVRLSGSITFLGTYGRQLSSEVAEQGFSVRRLFFLLIGILVLTFFDTLDDRNKKFFGIYIFGLIILPFFSYIPGFSRITDLMISYIVMGLTTVHSTLYSSKKKSVIFAFDILYMIAGISIITRLQ